MAYVVAIEYQGISSQDSSSIGTVEALRKSLKEAVAANRGEISRSAGATFILTFANAKDAFSFASKYKAQPVDESLPAPRIGIHVGDVCPLENDILGEAVDVALALKNLSARGDIVCSAQASALAPDEFKPHKGATLKNSISPFPGIEAIRFSANGGYSDRGTGNELARIRESILGEIRKRGRRLSVDEAIAQFGPDNPEAMEVIASLAESGILAKQKRSEDLGSSIESAIHAIVSDIERAVDRDSRADRRGINISIDSDTFKESASRWKTVGHELKRQIKESVKNQGVSRNLDARDKGSQEYESFRKYEGEIVKKSDRAGKSIGGSIAGFAISNAVVWFVNLNFSPGILWAPIVTVFTAFGIVESIVKAARARLFAREIAAFPELNQEDTKELQSINKERDSIVSHALSAISVPAGLAVINLSVSPGQTWFVIPSAILVGTFVLHLLGYITGMPGRMRRFLDKLGITAPWRSLRSEQARRTEKFENLGPYTDTYEEASSTSREILASMRAMDPAAAEEMKPQLDGYLSQVLLLTKTANELDTIIGDIPMSELKKDKAELVRKKEGASGELLKRYDAGIEEIKAQEDSFAGLKEQREIIDLRIRSSVNQLSQMKMELARARAADAQSTTSGAESALTSLRQRSVELSRYIEDLKQGHLETKRDPFEELEEQFKLIDSKKE